MTPPPTFDYQRARERLVVLHAKTPTRPETESLFEALEFAYHIGYDDGTAKYAGPHGRQQRVANDVARAGRSELHHGCDEGGGVSELLESLPGDQYMPSNSSEGYSFLEQWCSNCQRDRAMREGVDIDECDDNERCDIIAKSFMGEAVEWRELANGQTKCVAFVPAGETIPTPRCDRTMDLF